MKFFTVEEAERHIPELERIFAVADQIRAQAEPKIAALESETPNSEPAQGAIDRAQLEFLSQSLEEAVRGIQKMGAVLKGLDPGLVDFPFKMGDDEIYLCWKRGESRIRYYHSVDEGFAGRQPIPHALLQH